MLIFQQLLAGYPKPILDEDLFNSLKTSRVFLMPFVSDEDCKEIFEFSKELNLQEISLPFEKVWMQSFDNSFLVGDSENGNPNYKFSGILFEEIDGGTDIRFNFFQTPENKGPEAFCFIKVTLSNFLKFPVEKNSPRESFEYLVRFSLALLLFKKNDFGEMSCLLRTKTSKRFGAEIHKVKKLVLVARNKKISEVNFQHGPIEWKHSWEVMGHWRKTPLVGKDRQGNYCVPGKTWVLPHVKGDGPLITKTRLFKD